jgi:diadenylate cyclase
VAKQIDAPVISVSEELALVAIHRRGVKRTLEPVVRVLSRADQALQILERYKARLDAVSGSLSALEVEDLVTVRDVATALQRAEMVRRIAEEIEEYVIELGADGRLILLQLEGDGWRRETTGGYSPRTTSAADDYELHDVMRLAGRPRHRDAARPARSPPCCTSTDAGLDTAIQPRGYRLLHKIPRLPEIVADHVVERFAHLQKIMRAGVPDLVEVEGVGEARARAIKDGLARLAETSILERYV